MSSRTVAQLAVLVLASPQKVMPVSLSAPGAAWARPAHSKAMASRQSGVAEIKAEPKKRPPDAGERKLLGWLETKWIANTADLPFVSWLSKTNDSQRVEVC